MSVNQTSCRNNVYVFSSGINVVDCRNFFFIKFGSASCTTKDFFTRSSTVGFNRYSPFTIVMSESSYVFVIIKFIAYSTKFSLFTCFCTSRILCNNKFFSRFMTFCFNNYVFLEYFAAKLTSDVLMSVNQTSCSNNVYVYSSGINVVDCRNFFFIKLSITYFTTKNLFTRSSTVGFNRYRPFISRSMSKFSDFFTLNSFAANGAKERFNSFQGTSGFSDNHHLFSLFMTFCFKNYVFFEYFAAKLTSDVLMSVDQTSCRNNVYVYSSGINVVDRRNFFFVKFSITYCTIKNLFTRSSTVGFNRYLPFISRSMIKFSDKFGIDYFVTSITRLSLNALFSASRSGCFNPISEVMTKRFDFYVSGQNFITIRTYNIL